MLKVRSSMEGNSQLYLSIWRRPSARQTLSPSSWRFGRVGLRKPQHRRSPMNVNQNVEPSSSKNSRVSFVKREAVPWLLPSAMKDLVSSRHRLAKHKGNLSRVSLPKPNRTIPRSSHSFSHFPSRPSLMYRTRVASIAVPLLAGFDALTLISPRSRLNFRISWHDRETP
jgi:hypothetical protein